MEGFETLGNIPATLRDLADQGYSSKQRGGHAQAIDGICIAHAMVIRGLDLPPCVIVEWHPANSPQDVHKGIRTFSSDQQLAEWLSHWNIRLGRRERAIN